MHIPTLPIKQRISLQISRLFDGIRIEKSNYDRVNYETGFPYVVIPVPIKKKKERTRYEAVRPPTKRQQRGINRPSSPTPGKYGRSAEKSGQWPASFDVREGNVR